MNWFYASLFLLLLVCDPVAGAWALFVRILLESLILAQDERWRRA